VLTERQIDSAVAMGSLMTDPARLRVLDFVGREREATPPTYAKLTGSSLADVRDLFGTLSQAGCLKPGEQSNFDGDDSPFKLTPVGQKLLELAGGL
jgi:hypothetical protein